MMVQWNDELFERFTQLRDEMRAAMKANGLATLIAITTATIACELGR